MNASKSGFVTGFLCVVATVIYLLASQPRQQTIDSALDGDASNVVAAADTENSDRLARYPTKPSQERANGDSASANGPTTAEFATSTASEIVSDEHISDQLDRSAVENSNPESTTSELPEKQGDYQAATTTPEKLPGSTATDFHHTPEGSPAGLSMSEQYAVNNATSEAYMAEPDNSAAANATSTPDYRPTPEPDPSIDAQNSSTDTQLSDIGSPLTKPIESQTTELTNERFWGPFNAEIRARSFAEHLSKLIEHPLFVVRDTQGYHIVFSYVSQSERESLRNRLTDAGLTLDK